MKKEEIVEVIKKQKDFFLSGKSLDVETRIVYLKRLKKSLIKYEKEMFEAARKDMGRSEAETYFIETRPTLNELDYALSNIKS
jgi:aldehyde dehydrogenase (NAD+)